MTSKTVAYYSAMLRVGLGDAFYRAFDQVLEEEEPLSKLTLSLCDCICDVNAVLQVLGEYLSEYPADDQAVYELILADLKNRCASGTMTRKGMVTALNDIAHALDKCMEEPWYYIVYMADNLDLCEDGIISENVFNTCFDAWFDYGQWLDVWELQNKENTQ